jgi:hypothetical protein
VNANEKMRLAPTAFGKALSFLKKPPVSLRSIGKTKPIDRRKNDVMLGSFLAEITR